MGVPFEYAIDKFPKPDSYLSVIYQSHQSAEGRETEPEPEPEIEPETEPETEPTRALVYFTQKVSPNANRIRIQNDEMQSNFSNGQKLNCCKFEKPLNFGFICVSPKPKKFVGPQ